jgi:hypothetical protein
MFVSLLLLVGSPLAGRHLAAVFGAGSGPVSSATLARDYASLPQSFEPNRGQSDPRVDFLSHGRGYSLFLAGGDATLLLSRGGHSHSATAVRMRLAGARPAVKASGAGRLPGSVNYLRGRHPSAAQTAIPTYRGVTYRGVYPGVDLRYYGSQRQLEYDFSLAPNADPSRIVLDFAGARGVDLAADGDLHLRLPGGVLLRERAPVAFQMSAGTRRPVAVRYVVRGDRVSFALGAYDRSRPLTIDPVVLAYSTYLGGGGADSGQGIAVDSAGSAYVTGWTTSTDFPTTALDTTQNGDDDVFVTKLAPDGKSLAYSTYLGGSSQDLGQAIAVDSAGSAYVTGRSLGPGFPTTPGALDSTVGGIADAFVAKLAPDGQSLVYSTYLGGSGQDNGEGIAVDSSGAAYVTGFADSADFPTTAGAFQTTPGGGRDDFVTKLAPDGGSLLYSTYLGGSADEGEHDQRGGIAVDSTGAAYVTGQTSSSDFPLKNALDSTLGGTQDAYVTKLAPNGKSLAYSTYLGGATYETGVGVGVDSAGSAYVTGLTTSADFPTQNAFDTTLRGSSDAFVSKFAPDGQSLAYSTYLGGSADENGAAVAVDSAGSAYVTGSTYSGNFPTTADASDTTLGGSQDAFVSKLAPDGGSLAYSTYLGGGDVEYGAGVAVDSAGAMYATGTTFSTDFPTAGAPFDTTLGGSEDAFVSKIANVAGGTGVPPPPPVPPAAVSFTKILSGPDGFASATPTFTFTSTVAGATFQCQFDGAAFEPCTTPLTRYGLPFGPHTFTVRAVRPSGEPDPQPDARVFTLGSTTQTHSCEIAISWDLGHPVQTCPVVHSHCPAGSKCTLKGTVDVTDDDQQIGWGGVVILQFAGSNSFPSGNVAEVSCSSDAFDQSVLTPCPKRVALSHLGAGDAIDASCEAGGAAFNPGHTVRGRDDARVATCTATLTIEPAAQLILVVGGANGALLAPGAGALAIVVAPGGHPRVVAAAAKPKPKPPVAPLHIKVKEPGVVKFRFKLSKAAKRTLTRRHKLTLKLKVSFKPAGARTATVRTQHVTLTHSAPLRCHPHKRIRCR